MTDYTAQAFALRGQGQRTIPSHTHTETDVAALVADLAASVHGGGSSYPVGSIDDPSNWTANLGVDYEFNATSSSLPSGWSWLNQGPASYNENWGAGSVSLPGGVAAGIHGVTRSLPTAPFTVTTKLNTVGMGGQFQKGGLILSDGTNVAGFWQTKGDGAVAVEYYSAPASYTSAYFGWTTTPKLPSYLRIIYTSASDVSFLIGDGADFMPVASSVTLGFTPTSIGFGATTETGSPIVTSCHWFRVR